MIDEDTAYELERQKRLDASPMFIAMGLGNFAPPVPSPEKPAPSLMIIDRGEQRRKEIIRLLGIRPRTTDQLADAMNITSQGIGRHLRHLAEAGVIDKELYGNGARTRWKLK